MELASSDLNAFARTLAETVEEIIDGWRAVNITPAGDETDPETLWNAFQQLLLALHKCDGRDDGRDPLHASEISELGDYGLNMLLDLERIATGLALTTPRDNLEKLSVDLGLWVARHDGELTTLDLIVNGVAKTANRLRRQADLERLFFIVEEVLEAVNPTLQSEASQLSDNPEQGPWKVLLMNRAIIATRALAPAMMDKAFTDILEQIPETAPGFFAEAIEQIELRGYPPPVAEVITRFYQLTTVPKTLH